KLKLEDLARPQAVEQHQGDQAEITKSAKAVPEFRDLPGGERNHEAPRLLQSQARHTSARPPRTERTPGSVSVLQITVLAGNLALVVETVEIAQGGQTVIDGLGGGLGDLVELVADIVEEDGLVQLGEGPGAACAHQRAK